MRRLPYALLCFVGLLCSAALVTGGPPRTQSGPPAPTRHTVAGPAANINAAIGQGATATITLQPVPPKTVPASSYPAGSAIVGHELTLPSVAAGGQRVWLEILVTGWAPQELKTVQAKFDSAGLSGANAMCAGVPAIGAGDLSLAMSPCTVNADCRATMSGLTSPCGWGEPSKCLTAGGPNFPYFPPGKYCEPGFQDQCDPEWIATGFLSIPQGGICETQDCTFGATAEPGEPLPDFFPSYLGTLVLDVPADAKGAYTIGFVELESFMQELLPTGDTVPIPLAALNPAVIHIPCGSCCTNLELGSPTCTDSVSEAECDALPTTNGHVFRPDSTCLSDPCCACTADGECDDADACTVDVCLGGCSCLNTPKSGWNPQTQCCDPATGFVAPIPSAPCLIGTCSLGGSSGQPVGTPLPEGTSCNSGDPCMPDAHCNAGGVCTAQQYAGPDCPKSRFISFVPQTGTISSAFRVRLLSLHHPDPPYAGGTVKDFTAFEGQIRWVGAPGLYRESFIDPTTLFASYLECAPHYADWSSIDLLHVSDAEVLPSSVYEVQSIAEGLDPENEGNYALVGIISTGRWGDIVVPFNPPSPNQQPDMGDVSALVNKFKSAVGAPAKARAMLAGTDLGGRGIIDMSYSQDVGFFHVSACVDAYKGVSYPYAGPLPCP